MNLLLSLCLAVHTAALMAWFGAYSLHRALGVALSPPVRRGLTRAGHLALVSGLLYPFLQTACVHEDPAAGLDPAQVLELLTQTSFGLSWLVRLGFVALAVLASRVPLLVAGRAVYFLLAAALASLALCGHAAAGQGVEGTAARLLLGLHLLAAGAWVGALPLLWDLAGRSAAPDLARTLRRFSVYGMGLVGLVVLSGVISAWIRIGGLELLVATSYGWLLLGKVALVGLMGAAALLNRNRYTPRLDHGDWAMREAARSGLRASVAAEMALGLLVVLIAALLGNAEAPR